MFHKQEFYMLCASIEFALHTTESLQEPIRAWHDNKIGRKVIEAGIAHFEEMNFSIVLLWDRLDRLNAILDALSSTDERLLEELRAKGSAEAPERAWINETDDEIKPDTLLEGLCQALEETNVRFDSPSVTAQVQANQWITSNQCHFVDTEVGRLEQDMRRYFIAFRYWVEEFSNQSDAAPGQSGVSEQSRLNPETNTGSEIEPGIQDMIFAAESLAKTTEEIQSHVDSWFECQAVTKAVHSGAVDAKNLTSKITALFNAADEGSFSVWALLAYKMRRSEGSTGQDSNSLKINDAGDEEDDRAKRVFNFTPWAIGATTSLLRGCLMLKDAAPRYNWNREEVDAVISDISGFEQVIRRDFSELKNWLEPDDDNSSTERFGPAHSAHKGFSNGCAKPKKENSSTEITVKKIGDWGLEKVPPENMTKLQNRFDTWGCPKCIGRYAHLCHLGIDLGPEGAIWELPECPRQAMSAEEFEQWSKDWKAENHWYLEECIEDYLSNKYPSEQEDILACIKAWEPAWEPPASK